MKKALQKISYTKKTETSKLHCSASFAAFAFGVFIMMTNAPASFVFAKDDAFKTSIDSMARAREQALRLPWDSPANDSANSGNTSKSWTLRSIGENESKFLQSLKWKEHKIGNYVLRTGLIFDKWIAAMQFVKDGKVELTEITPPYEYVKLVDPLTALTLEQPLALDADRDGNLEVAFLHEKLNDAHYHMYTVYRLNKDYPHLIWKAGGNLGDWAHGSKQVKNAKWQLKTGAQTTK